MEKLQLQCVIDSEEEGMSNTIDTCRLENDVLRMRFRVMGKDHAAEKNEIIKAKDKTIGELKATNEELNITIGDQSDKMQQMDKASRGKDNEIESLTKRAGELKEQIRKLEMNLKQAKVMYKQSTAKNAQKDKRIKELESELSEAKEKLKITIIAKEEQESWFATYIKTADEKQERRDKQLQKNHEEILCQIKSMDIRSKSIATKDSKVRITDSHNVQISFESQNGRNDDPFYSTPAFCNRNKCKLSKGNNNLPK